MACVSLVSLALFLLATSWKESEAGACARTSCSQSADCGSGCICLVGPPIPYPFPRDIGVCIGGVASVANMIEEHPNLCRSDDECIKKGTGNFCVRYSDRYADYGWCFHSLSESLKGFLKMPTKILK
ncbi:albumin-1-like isoform X2 [Vigna unguiculata]|uniref:Albumin I chain a n=1 Tax=Vigna unguiculata TaxID=3917 RepID=A0A4D6LBC9_VIGUN|nr:albumin-1-like isoform X2 [Vigna unguiculata]QCD85881.1 Albumin I chain a [Vigna unguiculata]